ncbi:PHP domain-containing protein [Clostridium guangxiense]|uniref:PHP domain-containing protein n=1 Tax=Clostridium guangxiense TaxID=1662055 RepID=UPI001E2B8B99|nr:PHP domain-containing protein [Clostridium guangxiense]MCD2348802.1 PHP domain-containing protein [Clostridium guangxiense]
MYFKGDFHTHTNASDGKFSAYHLLGLAKSCGIDIMAVTDHDTTDNLNNAIKESMDIGLKVIPGIELSTLHNGESVHILGYFRDSSYMKKDFQNFLNDMKDYRVWRAKKIVSNLSKYFNINLNYENVTKNTNGVIARPHIARAIIAAGYNYTTDYIFDNILNKESPAYIPNKKVGVDEGIKILKNENAVVVLAHPILIKKTTIEEMIKFDFDGIEAIYPQNSKEDTKRFIAIAKENNKLITAGSDFHTDDAGDTKHGRLGNIYLDSENIDKLLKRLS